MQSWSETCKRLEGFWTERTLRYCTNRLPMLEYVCHFLYYFVLFSFIAKVSVINHFLVPLNDVWCCKMQPKVICMLNVCVSTLCTQMQFWFIFCWVIYLLWYWRNWLFISDVYVTCCLIVTMLSWFKQGSSLFQILSYRAPNNTGSGSV